MHTQVLPPQFTFQSFFLQSYCKLFPIRPARSQGQHRLFLEAIIGVSLLYLSKGTNFNIHKRTALMYSLPPYSAAISSCWQCEQVTWESDQAVILVLTHHADLGRSLTSEFSERGLITLEVFKPGIKHPKVTTDSKPQSHMPSYRASQIHVHVVKCYVIQSLNFSFTAEGFQQNMKPTTIHHNLYHQRLTHLYFHTRMRFKETCLMDFYLPQS